MTAKKILGYVLIGSPFIAIFIFSIRYAGLIPTIGIFGGVAVVAGIIFLGINLIQ